MSFATRAPVGIAHLSLLDLSPPELVSTAAEAGYDFVGIRVRPATPGEHQYPMQAGSALSKETLRLLDATGLTVRDVEFVAVGPDSTRDDWMPALEAGAALGASMISVAGTDPDRQRLLDTLSHLVSDGRTFGIQPALEPISYQPVSRVNEAAAVARAAGAGVLIDAVHVHRGGSTIEEIRELAPAMVPCLQLCDGPKVLPEHLDVPDDLPLGMSTNGSPLQLEARVLRQLAGDGELDLADLVRALPAGTPISMEVPNAHLRASMSAVDYARRVRESAERVLPRATVGSAVRDG